MKNEAPHLPVMLRETIDFLLPDENKTYIDATFGAGSFSRAILNCNDSCKVWAIDQDLCVIKYADELKNIYKDRFNFIFGNFSKIVNLVDCEQKFDGIIFDIGVSSMQIDDPDRGFSFMRNGPLDMRMNQSFGETALKFINSASEKNIADIIYYYGEETRKNAQRIAKLIFSNKNNIKTTKNLSDVVLQAMGPQKSKINPATKTFQAIRIYINKELHCLHEGLIGASSMLANGGKIIVVSFHGLECRIVKRIFRDLCFSKHFKILTKKAIVPSYDEIKKNPRARSAKMRVLAYYE